VGSHREMMTELALGFEWSAGEYFNVMGGGMMRIGGSKSGTAIG